MQNNNYRYLSDDGLFTRHLLLCCLVLTDVTGIHVIERKLFDNLEKLRENRETFWNAPIWFGHGLHFMQETVGRPFWNPKKTLAEIDEEIKNFKIAANRQIFTELMELERKGPNGVKPNEEIRDIVNMKIAGWREDIKTAHLMDGIVYNAKFIINREPNSSKTSNKLVNALYSNSLMSGIGT